MARGEIVAARGELDRAAGLALQVSTVVSLRGCCAAREGRFDEGRAAFDNLLERYGRGAARADDLALMAAVLGDWPSARHWLTEACTQRAPFLGYVDVEPAMVALFQDPDCRTLLRSHGFGSSA